MAEDLDKDYDSAGFGRRLGFGRRPALVVVDFVRAYLEPGSPLYAGVEDTLLCARELLVAARAAAIPVFHTNVRYTPGLRDGGVFVRKVEALKVFEGDSPLGEFAEGLTPAATEAVITKQYPSAFFGTSLASSLTSLRVDTVLVAGVTTSGCVRATALDAMQHGFVPVVVREAVGDRDVRPHEANLFDLGAKYADVVALAEVVDYLRALEDGRRVQGRQPRRQT
ncbi:MAG: isochorismatase [Chromatiales bacterium]|jgi:nicotinamidase-related amidase|nr:MAG: isochorismatase [Chromatiales bacterium]